MMRRLARLHRNQDGNVAIELTLFVPIWVLLISLLVQYALILWAEDLTIYAAGKGARSAVVIIPSDEGLEEPPNRMGPRKQELVERSVAFALLSTDDDPRSRVQVDISGASGTRDVFASTERVVVRVSYRLPLVVPIANRILGEPDGSGYTRTITAAVEMHNEGLPRLPGE